MHKIDLNEDTLSRWRGKTASGIDAKRTALIVIDLQYAFMDKAFPSHGPHALDIVPTVNKLITRFRSAGAKVVFARHTVVGDAPLAPPKWQLDDEALRPALQSLRPNERGHYLHADLAVTPDDQIVDKHRYSVFISSSAPLDKEFREAGIDTVIITGTLTNVCCESSARDASMLGYDVIFVADATAALDDESHNAALRNIAGYFGTVKMADQVLHNIAGPI